MYTTGSGAGVGDAAGTIPTVRRIVRPFALARFSGTTRKPQRASAGRVVGNGSVGHAVGSNLGAWSADAALEAAPAVGLVSSATAAPTTTTSTMRTAATKHPQVDEFVRVLPSYRWAPAPVAGCNLVARGAASQRDSSLARPCPTFGCRYARRE